MKRILRFEEERQGIVSFGLLLFESGGDTTISGKRLVTVGTQLSARRHDASDMKLPMVELTTVRLSSEVLLNLIVDLFL